jgi:hypothetical protein
MYIFIIVIIFYTTVPELLSAYLLQQEKEKVDFGEAFQISYIGYRKSIIK